MNAREMIEKIKDIDACQGLSVDDNHIVNVAAFIRGLDNQLVCLRMRFVDDVFEFGVFEDPAADLRSTSDEKMFTGWLESLTKELNDSGR